MDSDVMKNVNIQSHTDVLVLAKGLKKIKMYYDAQLRKLKIKLTS